MKKNTTMIVGVLFLGCLGAEAAIHIASPFTDNMVLQQGMSVPV